MKQKKITYLSFFYVFTLFFLAGSVGFSQTVNTAISPEKPKQEAFEDIYLHWFISLDKARIEANIPRPEFDMFTRFSEKALDSLRADFMKRIGNKSVNATNVGKFESVLISSINSLYGTYQSIKKSYPSSVEEYRHNSPLPPVTCSSSCNNINFATGDLSGWNAYYGFNNSSVSAFTVTNITGGVAGAVTLAANDVLTSTPGFYNAGIGPNPTPDYQIKITSGSIGDAIIPSVPQVSPFGGSHSVMLGDSTQVNYGVAILSQTFSVTPSNENFTYQYAVFLANPLHNYYQQPFFKVAMLDQLGDTIPHCGEYNVVAGNGTQTFDSITYTDTALSEIFTVYYKNWTMVEVPLKQYLGQCVTIIFESADCSLGGHFGYAYVDASCSPNGIITSSPNLCGQDSISLTAPPGSAKYIWSGPTNGIIGSSSNQTVWVDSAGVYRVILVPVTGGSCADTLYDTVGKSPGPIPKPDFYTFTGCAGQAIHFYNTSTDTATAHFYWDFYNIGVINDSTDIDPNWIYTSPGTYTVKMEEINNGCGADKLLTVHIDSTVTGGFIVAGGCAGTMITAINTSTGSTSYKWNFGDPGSGPLNNSTTINGSHIFNNPGTYTITLIAKNGGPCPDTVKQAITISPYPKPLIKGLDSVCPNVNDTLTVTGGTAYSWSTGATTSTIIVSSPITVTYSVTAYDGPCVGDTTFTIHIVSPAAKITASKKSVCAGDTSILTAGGGTTYRWSTGSTSNTIIVSPFVPTTYTLYAYYGTCTDSTTITIGILKAVTCILSLSNDSICPGSTTTITATATGGPPLYYKWNNGATTTTITVAPPISTTYSIKVSNGFCPFDTSIYVYVKQAPTLIIKHPVDSICIGSSVTLNVSGGISYIWAPSAGLSCITCPNPVASPTATTTYAVIGLDTDGCTSVRNVFVLVETPPVIGDVPDQSICAGNEVSLVAYEQSGFDGGFKWSPGGSTSYFINVFPKTTTTYTVSYTNLCGTASTTATVFVKPSPNPLFSADVTKGCAPLCIQFKDMSTISGATIVQWDWDFGNGDTSFYQNPIYCYKDTGTFSPRITAVSDNGCSATLLIDGYISVYSNPVANFIYSPNPVSNLEPTVQFTDKSTDAYGIAWWTWNFEDGSAGTSENSLQNPVHIYPDTGAYCPMLVVMNNKGCVDTIVQCMAVDPLYTLYIPSAFSPNGDGDNEFFQPKGAYIKTFEMYIFDRWGMELYHTKDIKDGWNGKVKDGSKICQEDSYVYNITATDWHNQKHSYIGTVTLIK